jgi:hypothetical protein
MRVRSRGQAPLRFEYWCTIPRVWSRLATVLLGFDPQGWITLLLGGLLALITLFTSYSHVHVPFIVAVALDQQIGALLLLALVPALVGDAQLATRCRLRAERD